MTQVGTKNHVLRLLACAAFVPLAACTEPAVEVAPEMAPSMEIVGIEDFVSTATELAAGYPTPPGGSVRPELIEPSIIARQSLESMMAFRVGCQWFQYWVDSRAAGDEGEAQRAAAMLLDMQDWPIVEADGLAPFYAPLLDAVAAGDAAAIEYHLGLNCADVRKELPAA